MQPDGGKRENCLTTFRTGNDSLKWYDRPCIENDAIDNPGHRFMCEATTEHHCKKNFTKTNFELPLEVRDSKRMRPDNMTVIFQKLQIYPITAPLCIKIFYCIKWCQIALAN